jgi:hypothetical protein
MRAAKIYLVLMGIMSVVFGVIYLVAPANMTDPMGFGILAPSALTDVRATYGGFQIGMGLFMLWCCLGSGRLYAGMFLALISVAAIAACRAIGLVIDGDVIDVLKYTLVFEVVLTVISLVLFLRTPKTA